MKFIKSLITILTVSSTLAYTVPIIKRDEIDNALANVDNSNKATDGKISSLDGQNKINAFNQAAPSNEQNSAGNVSKECLSIVNQYKICFEKLTIKNYDEVCEKYNSPQCQNTIKKKVIDNEACKDFKDAVVQVQNLVDVSTISMNLSCGKSENGDYCPIAKFGKNAQDIELTDEIINETCKSNSCRDNAVQSFTMYQKLNEQYTSQSNIVKRKFIEESRIESALKLLNNEQCAKQAKSSDAYSLNIKNTLFLTVGIFFLLFI